MNRNELIEYLRNPSSLSKESLKDLQHVIKEAPYFQSARMLMAKGCKLLGSPVAKKYVSSAAVYATDRNLLKKYISGELLFLTKPPEKKPIKQTPSVKSKNRQVPVNVKPTKSSPESRKVSPPEKKITIPGIPTGALDAMLDELQQDMEDLKSSRMRFVNVQQKIEEEDAVSAALERAAIVDKLKEEIKEEVKDEIDETPPVTLPDEPVAKPQPVDAPLEESVPEQELPEPPPKEKKKPTRKVEAEKPKPASIKEETPQPKEEQEEIVPRRGFANRNTLSTDFDKTTAETLKKLEDDMWGDADEFDQSSEAENKPKRKPAKESTKSAKPTSRAKKTTSSPKKTPAKSSGSSKTTPKKPAAKKPSASKKSSSEGSPSDDDDDGKGQQVKFQKKIIDKFLKENPSIARAKDASSNESDLADSSSAWNDDLASENLAEIYLNQGNKKRAIEIYEALSLKFPEKKSYFADLISKIK